MPADKKGKDASEASTARRLTRAASVPTRSTRPSSKASSPERSDEVPASGTPKRRSRAGTNPAAVSSPVRVTRRSVAALAVEEELQLPASPSRSTRRRTLAPKDIPEDKNEDEHELKKIEEKPSSHPSVIELSCSDGATSQLLASPARSTRRRTLAPKEIPEDKNKDAHDLKKIEEESNSPPSLAELPCPDGAAGQLPASPARSTRRHTLGLKEIPEDKNENSHDLDKTKEESSSRQSPVELSCSDGAASQLPASPARSTRRHTLARKEIPEDKNENSHDLDKTEEESRGRPSPVGLSCSDGAASQLPASPARSTRRHTLARKEIPKDKNENSHDLGKTEEESSGRPSPVELSCSDGAASQLPASPARTTRKCILAPKEIPEDKNESPDNLNKTKEESSSCPSSVELSCSGGDANQLPALPACSTRRRILAPKEIPEDKNENSHDLDKIDEENSRPSSVELFYSDGATCLHTSSIHSTKRSTLVPKEMHQFREENWHDLDKIEEEPKNDAKHDGVERGVEKIKTPGSMLPKRIPGTYPHQQATPEPEIQTLKNKKESESKGESSAASRIPSPSLASLPVTPLAGSPGTSMELRSLSNPSPTGRSRPEMPVATSPRTSIELRSSSKPSPPSRSRPASPLAGSPHTPSPSRRSRPGTPVAMSPRTSMEMRSSPKASPDRHAYCHQSESPVSPFSPVRRSPRNSPVRQGRRGSGDRVGLPGISPLAIKTSPKAVNSSGLIDHAEALAAIKEVDDKNSIPSEQLESVPVEDSSTHQSHDAELEKHEHDKLAENIEDAGHTETKPALEEESLSDAEIKAAEEAMNRLSPIKHVPSPGKIDTDTVCTLGLRSSPVTSTCHGSHTPCKDSEAKSNSSPPSRLNAILPYNGDTGSSLDAIVSGNSENTSLNKNASKVGNVADEDKTRWEALAEDVCQCTLEAEEKKSPKRKSLEGPIRDTTPPKQTKLSEELLEEADESGGDFDLLVDENDLKTRDAFDESVCGTTEKLIPTETVLSAGPPRALLLSPVKEVEESFTPVKQSLPAHELGLDLPSPTEETKEDQQSPVQREKSPLLRSTTYTIIGVDRVMVYEVGHPVEGVQLSSKDNVLAQSEVDQPSPEKVVATPNEGEPSPAKKTEVSPAEDVEPSSTKKAEVSPAIEIVQSPTKGTPVSQTEGIEPSPTKNVPSRNEGIESSPAKKTGDSPTQDKPNHSESGVVTRVEEIPSNPIREIVSSPTKEFQQEPTNEVIHSPTKADDTDQNLPNAASPIAESVDSGNASEEEGKLPLRVRSPIAEEREEESEEQPSLPDLDSSLPISCKNAGTPEVQPLRRIEVIKTQYVEKVSDPQDSEEDKSEPNDDSEDEAVSAKDFIDDEAEESEGSDDSDEEMAEESDSATDYSDQEVLDVSCFIANEAKEKKKSIKDFDKSCFIVKMPEEAAAAVKQEKPKKVESKPYQPKPVLKPVFQEEVISKSDIPPAQKTTFKSSTAAGFVAETLQVPRRTKQVDLACASSSAADFTRSVTAKIQTKKRPAANEAVEGAREAKKRATDAADSSIRAPAGGFHLKLTKIPKGTTISELKQALREFGIAEGLVSIKFVDWKRRGELIADAVYDTEAHSQKAVDSYGKFTVKGHRAFFLLHEDSAGQEQPTNVAQCPPKKQTPPKKKSPLKKDKFVAILSGLPANITMNDITQAYAVRGIHHISKVMIFKLKSAHDGKLYAKMEFSKKTALLKALIVSEGLRIGGKPIKMTLKEKPLQP